MLRQISEVLRWTEYRKICWWIKKTNGTISAILVWWSHTSVWLPRWVVLWLFIWNNWTNALLRGCSHERIDEIQYGAQLTTIYVVMPYFYSVSNEYQRLDVFFLSLKSLCGFCLFHENPKISQGATHLKLSTKILMAVNLNPPVSVLYFQL